MEIVLGLIVAAAIGVVWVAALRRTAARRRLITAPKPVTAVLDAYRKRRWDQVVADAPTLLSAPSDGDDTAWRP